MHDIFISYSSKDFHPLLNKIPPNTRYINNLCVNNNHRNKGIGYKLLKTAMETYTEPKIILDCLANNTIAISLYNKCGFVMGKKFDGFAGNSDEVVECLEFGYRKGGGQ